MLSNKQIREQERIALWRRKYDANTSFGRTPSERATEADAAVRELDEMYEQLDKRFGPEGTLAK